MANVSRIVVISILFSLLLAAISITNDHKRKSANDEGLPRFLMFARSYIAGIISYIAAYLIMNTQSPARFLFMLVVWFTYCAILASMIIQSVFIFDYNHIWIKNLNALLSYYALFSVMIELFCHKFNFNVNNTGILFTPGIIPLGLYYGIPIIIYYICMIFLLYHYRKEHTKVREKHLMMLGCYAIIPSLFGLILESVLETVFNVRYPVFFTIMIITFKLMSRINIENRSFMLLKPDFESLLKADNTDAVFVCDDEMRVLFQNKAADVNSKMYSDVYIGRKLSEIFIIERDVLRAMTSKDAKNGLMIQAVYPVTENSLVMSVEFIYDCCDEILCYIITIPNYMVAVDENVFEALPEQNNEMMKEFEQKHITITDKPDNPHAIQDKSSIDPNSNILLIDDDLGRLDMNQALLEPYDITITRAIGGRSAIEMLLDPCYDAVFIAYDMKKLNGIETAKRIRGMGGSYYNDVPLIFIIDEPVANVYKELLSVSFNDYIETPISISKLNTIMARWLWRRYALTDTSNTIMGNTRAVRYLNEMNQLYRDCVEFSNSNKWNYIAYTLKGMKRLCSRLEDKNLLDACDNMLDIYIRGQYESMGEYLNEFKTEFERVRESVNQGNAYY